MTSSVIVAVLCKVYWHFSRIKGVHQHQQLICSVGQKVYQSILYIYVCIFIFTLPTLSKRCWAVQEAQMWKLGKRSYFKFKFKLVYCHFTTCGTWGGTKLCTHGSTRSTQASLFFNLIKVFLYFFSEHTHTKKKKHTTKPPPTLDEPHRHEHTRQALTYVQRKDIKGCQVPKSLNRTFKSISDLFQKQIQTHTCR